MWEGGCEGYGAGIEEVEVGEWCWDSCLRVREGNDRYASDIAGYGMSAICEHGLIFWLAAALFPFTVCISILGAWWVRRLVCTRLEFWIGLHVHPVVVRC